MKRALNILGESVFNGPEQVEIGVEAVNDFMKNCLVVLPAGGEGSRLRAIGGGDHHKTSIPLPGGKTMVERTIELYRGSGLTRFLLLLYHRGESITEILGDGSKYGISVDYSWDPGRPVGRGGAILNALVSGKIGSKDNLIVHNPDDQIINFPGDFPGEIIRGHLNGVGNGAIATVVVVRGTPYEFSGMKVERGRVSEIETYPFIPVPTHIGVTLFSHGAHKLFRDLFDLSKKTDFEGVLFPRLVAEKRLWAVDIPSETWLSVNTPKAMGKLVRMLEGQK